MATVRQSVRRRVFSHDPEQGPSPRRRRRWWLVACGILVVALWLAPMLVAHSPLLTWIVGLATADMHGKVRVEGASLGWFSPVQVSDVEIRDEKDETVLEVAHVTSERWLSGFLWNWTKLGRLRVENPKLTLVLRDDGSNCEDVLREYLQGESSGTSVDCQVEIIDGQVLLNDARTNRSWLVQNFQLNLSIPADGKPTQLQTSGVVADQQGHGGRFEAAMHLGQGEGKPDDLTLKTQNVPLALIRPVLCRFVPETQLEGWLTSSIQCQSSNLASLEQVTIQGQLNAERFLFRSPQLSGDQVALAQIQSSCQVVWQKPRLQIDQLVVDSDVGSASAKGVLRLGDDNTAQLPQEPCEIRGQIDLARLAAMLPKTLRIREDTRVTSGHLQLALSSQPGADGMVWQGRLDANNLTADNQGQRLAWPQPILVELAAREGKGTLVVDKLHCQSDFLRIDGAGTTEEFTATANLDLNRLVAQLNGLVDFGDLRLAGDGWAKFHWKQPTGHGFVADGQLQVQGFHLASGNETPWIENKLWANFSASGQTDFSVNTRLETAVLEVTAGDDRLEARLQQPIPDFRNGGTWPVSVRAAGDLARMLPRLRPWMSTDGVTMAGRYQLEGQITGNAESVAIGRTKLTVDQFQFRSASWNIQEPRVELTAEGGWNQKQGRLELESAQLTSSALAAQTKNLTLAWPTSGAMTLTGSATYQGQLDRLQAWTITPAQPPGWRIGGQLAGQMECQSSAGGIAARLDSSIQNLVVVNQSGQQFHEPQVRLVGRGTYQNKTGTLVVEQAELTSETLGATAGGQYVSKDDAGTLAADGKVRYDLEKISALMRSYLGEGIYAAGRGTSSVTYRGPLACSAGQGSAAFGWQWANIYGFEVNPGEIQLELAKGVLHMRPLDLAVSEGRVRLAPTLQVANDPMVFSMAPGRVVEGVRINPRMCAHALQYIAPVMAGVTTAEGRFSIEMDRCLIPLSDPSRGEIVGRMLIHSVEVGPGPLVQELAILLGRPSPARLTRESVIPFRLVDGRVEHKNLELVFPDVTIRTSGSVGLDKSLTLMAEMPVPPKWIGNNPLGTALKNQTIRLPINGTLTKPTIDRATLDRLSQQFVRNAAGNLIQDQLNKHQDVIQDGVNKINTQLDRLLVPPPRPTNR